MAAVSPFLADVLSKADLDDCTIFMPDVEVNAVTRIFERIYMFGALQGEFLKTLFFSSFFSFE